MDRFRLALRRIVAAGVVAAFATAAAAQIEQRAAPITGPGVVTIGNIARDARVNLRSGPAPLFPVVAQLGYGTRVEKGACIGGGSSRWCRVDTTDGRHSGYVSARFLVEGAAPPSGGGGDGPDFLQVRGLPSGDRLNVRRDPSARSPALATLREGEVVQNLGCRTSDGARWCRIRSIEGMDVTGWVSGRYLREAARPRPPQGGGSGAHGPDTYIVSGLPGGDRLNVRLEPTTGSPVIATLGPGERVRNLGCQQIGQGRWCRIRTVSGADLTGWVNGRYLREG
jgi:uncharacterized protein YraI